MSDISLDRHVLTDVSWWHWVLTIPLLAAHLASVDGALKVTMVLCAAATVYFCVKAGGLRPYPVQIRLAYLSLLLLGMLPAMSWINWVQLVGTTAMVVFGYCLLARTLSLAPWNRTQPLRRSLVRYAFLEQPCAGGLVRWPSAMPNAEVACCSLKRPAVPLEASESDSWRSVHAEAH